MIIIIGDSAEARDILPKDLVWSEFKVSKFLEYDACIVH